jgi:hypothetical protein
VARTAVVAGTATAVSNRVSRRQAGRWAEQDQMAYQQQASAAPPPAPEPSGGGGDVVSQIRELGELKAQGLLSEAEFEQQKRRILGS